MDIELIDQEGNHIKYGMIYSHNEVKDCLEREASDMQPEVKANGFRPGKVPVDYIIRMYGEKLHIKAISKKITADIQEIIKKNDYNLASQPVYNFRPRQETGDTNFYIELELFLMPDLPQIVHDDLEITKYLPNDDAYQEIVDNNLLMFQIMTADFDDIAEGLSQDNDKVLFTIEVTVDGEEMSALGGDMQAIIGQEQAPPEIEEQIKGRKVGEEIVYTREYPEDATDLFAPFLAGTTTVYKIKILKVERPIIKELDEEKVKKIGFQDYDHLFEILEGNTKNTVENVSYSKMREDFLSFLNELFQNVSIPDFMVSQEAHHIAMNEVSVKNNVDAMAEVTAGKMKIEVTELHKKVAEKNVRIGLFIRNYVQEHNIETSDNEVKAELEKHLQELTRLNSIRPEQKEKNYEDVALKARTIVLEKKVLDHVFAQTQIKEVKLDKKPFFDAVKSHKQ